MKEIIVLKKEHKAYVTLNREDACNAFTMTMIESLCREVIALDQDESVRVIIFKGAGKHFCAGGDISAMKEKREMFAGESNELRKRYEYGIQQIPLMMERLQTPTIAMVNGAAIGAGLDFACMSDLRVGHKYTKMGETFSKLALVPGDGGTYFLPRIIGYPKAMEMFLTGDIYDGQKCYNLGLLNIYANDLEKETDALADKIAGNSPIALSLTKKALKVSYHQDLQTSLDMLSSFQAITQRTADHFEAISAFNEKRSPQFEGK